MYSVLFVTRHALISIVGSFPSLDCRVESRDRKMIWWKHLKFLSGANLCRTVDVIAAATGKMMTMRVTLKYEATLPSSGIQSESELELESESKSETEGAETRDGNDWLFLCTRCCCCWLLSVLKGEGGWEGEGDLGQRSASVNCAWLGPIRSFCCCCCCAFYGRSLNFY